MGMRMGLGGGPGPLGGGCGVEMGWGTMGRPHGVLTQPPALGQPPNPNTDPPPNPNADPPKSQRRPPPNPIAAPSGPQAPRRPPAAGSSAAPAPHWFVIQTGGGWGLINPNPAGGGGGEGVEGGGSTAAALIHPGLPPPQPETPT